MTPMPAGPRTGPFRTSEPPFQGQGTGPRPRALRDDSSAGPNRRGDGQKPRVLVIEDNATNLDLIVYLLECTGHEAIVAINGRDGVRQAIEGQPDLILCDIQLPDIDGYDVLREVRRGFAVPVIAVTACAMVGDREKILAAGFDGYLPKPIEPETLLNELASYLGKDA